MRILVSNDDGIYAPGIYHLAQSLAKIAEVVVVAPDTERSATGHAITMHHPLRVRETELPDLNIKAVAVNGTPADCIKIGVDVIMDKKPDLIFSGINRGPNLGTDVLYSGTVSAAIEGCILGYPSAAVSMAGFEINDFGAAGAAAVWAAERMIERRLPLDTLININVPNLSESEIRGKVVTRLGVRKYNDHYVERRDPRGNIYYWLAGEPIEEELVENTDVWAVKEGYISITPIHYDLTDYKRLTEVSDWI